MRCEEQPHNMYAVISRNITTLVFAFFCILLQGCWTSPYQCQYCEGDVCNSKVVNCKKDLTQCYSVWYNNSGKVKLVQQGCFLKSDTCSDGPDCIGRPHVRGVIFCCCTGNLCNANFTSVEIPPVSTYTTKPPATTAVVIKTTRTRTEPTRKHRPLSTLLYSIVPVCGFAVILVFGFFIYYRHKTPSSGRGAITLDEELRMCVPPSPDLSKHLPNVQLVEILSRGQYCTVWKANYLKETVAVKITSVHEKASWLAEKDFYTNYNLSHDNILKFITAEAHTECQIEYWLITEYHEKGSVADYLKQNIISWNDLCKLTASIASGLAYLHSDQGKPCIAHRDVKSKNILVKKDLTCCLADFGLAAKFEVGHTPGDTHGQVGTKRYMAPEVLEGAITFTRDAFLRIDMYALALVLWEILSRCTAASGPVEEYRLPFEDEVGIHPSIEDMQQTVSQKKIRPGIREDWRLHPGMELMCRTVEECWDQDAEARLTAECVYERLSSFFGYSYNSAPEYCSVVTPLINNTGRPCLESSV